jgi:serine kinase of HPr protein (carbohydrate metabolism regulator)
MTSDTGQVISLQKPDNNKLIHGTCLLVGARALLLRGPTGSGKSRLAGALLLAARLEGRFARMVADDQTRLEVAGARLILSSPPTIGGLREYAGIGIFRENFERQAVAGLVIDLVKNREELVRLPDPQALMTNIAGISLARLTLDARAPGTLALVMEALTRLAANHYLPDTLSIKGVDSLLRQVP